MLQITVRTESILNQCIMSTFELFSFLKAWLFCQHKPFFTILIGNHINIFLQRCFIILFIHYVPCCFEHLIFKKMSFMFKAVFMDRITCLVNTVLLRLSLLVRILVFVKMYFICFSGIVYIKEIGYCKNLNVF